MDVLVLVFVTMVLVCSTVTLANVECCYTTYRPTSE